VNRWSLYLTAYRTIVTKEILRFTRIWMQTILPSAITTSLYFVIFGKLIGERIGQMGGYSYIEFIVPGLILMSVIQNSYANVVSSFFSTKLQHYIEEMLIAPVPDWVLLAGYVSGGVVRGTLVGAVVTLISLFFTDFTIFSYGLTLLVFVLTSILFALGGFINAVYAKTFDDVSIVPTFILTPLTYLGGVFYSIELLPGFWQGISLVNPVLYMVNAFRQGLLGVSDIDFRLAVMIILAFIIMLTLFSLSLLKRGVGIKK